MQKMSNDQNNMNSVEKMDISVGEEGDSNTANSIDDSAQMLSYFQTLNTVPQEIGRLRDSSIPLEAISSTTRSNTDTLKGRSSGGESVLGVLGVPQRGLPKTLLGSPFAHRLFLATSCETFSTLDWSTGGRELCLNYIGLQDYLFGDKSIFHCRTVTQFTRLLFDNGFEQVWLASEERPFGGIWLYYKHPNFRRGYPDEVFKVAPLEDSVISEHSLLTDPTEPKHMGNATMTHNKRMGKRGDLCSQFEGTCSALEVARINFRTMLRFEKDAAQLDLRVHRAEMLAQQMTQRARQFSKLEDRFEATGDAARYMQPSESVLNFQPGVNPDYAGYYGDVPATLVNDFFGKHLPRYGGRTNNGYKEIVTDAMSKVNEFQQNLPIGMSLSDEEDDVTQPVNNTPPTALALEEQVVAPTQPRATVRASEQAPIDDKELEREMQVLCDGLEVCEDIWSISPNDDVDIALAKIHAEEPPVPEQTQAEQDVLKAAEAVAAAAQAVDSAITIIKTSSDNDNETQK